MCLDSAPSRKLLYFCCLKLHTSTFACTASLVSLMQQNNARLPEETIFVRNK